MRIKSVKCFIVLFVAAFLMLAQAPFVMLQTPVVHAAKASKIAINYEKIVIASNQSFTLHISGTKDKVKWKSSDASIATVSTQGVVIGKRMGTATITATVAKKNYNCQVTVSSTHMAEPFEHWEHYSADYMSSYDLTLLDMNSTFEDFKSVGYKINGIYASVHSEKTIYIEGLDKKGRSLGIAKNNGLSYVQFDNAANLRIMNPEHVLYTIDFIPANPTVIRNNGYYTYDDFTWYKLKDGNIQAPVIFAMTNSYMEFIVDTQEEKRSGDSIIGYLGKTPHDTGKIFDPEIMGAWQRGYLTANTIEEAGNLKNLKIYVDQYKVYLDDKDIFVYGKKGLDLPKELKNTIFKYRDLVKKIASEKYLPDETVWSKSLRFRYTYEYRSSASKNYMSMNIADIPSTYYHEMAHYYHLESMDYGSQISAWTEGIAQVLAEDALLSLGEDTMPVTHMQNISKISNADLKSFEKYFLNVGYEECYAIGYNFIRFIQSEYDEKVVYKINENIMKNKQYQKYDSISPSNRTEEADKIFIQAIKDATSKDVFTRFVEEVVKQKMN